MLPHASPAKRTAAQASMGAYAQLPSSPSTSSQAASGAAAARGDGVPAEAQPRTAGDAECGAVLGGAGAADAVDAADAPAAAGAARAQPGKRTKPTQTKQCKYCWCDTKHSTACEKCESAARCVIEHYCGYTFCPYSHEDIGAAIRAKKPDFWSSVEWNSRNRAMKTGALFSDRLYTDVQMTADLDVVEELAKLLPPLEAPRPDVPEHKACKSLGSRRAHKRAQDGRGGVPAGMCQWCNCDTGSRSVWCSPHHNRRDALRDMVTRAGLIWDNVKATSYAAAQPAEFWESEVWLRGQKRARTRTAFAALFGTPDFLVPGVIFESASPADAAPHTGGADAPCKVATSQGADMPNAPEAIR